MTSRAMRRHCELDAASRRILDQALTHLGLSVRAHDRVLKVARTILVALENSVPLRSQNRLRARRSDATSSSSSGSRRNGFMYTQRTPTELRQSPIFCANRGLVRHRSSSWIPVSRQPQRLPGNCLLRTHLTPPCERRLLWTM
jgi:hypothetical protein